MGYQLSGGPTYRESTTDSAVSENEGNGHENDSCYGFLAVERVVALDEKPTERLGGLRPVFRA